MANKTLTEKNLDNFIDNNFDKRDRRKEESLKFEWFVNSMHIWHCSSQFYNSKSQIGKDISLGTAQGGDAFFIIVNNEQIFTINDDNELILQYVKNKGREVSFHFIQSKKSENADWGDFLKFIDVVLMILKGENVDNKEKELLRVKNLYDCLTNPDNKKLGSIKHKLELYFYTDKNANDIDSLKKNWKENIERQKNNLKEYISESQIVIRGSSFINDLYEKFTSNKYELLVNKEEVIEADETKYIIGFLTAKELLDCIAPLSDDGERAILPDVFKNNIRLYIGNTSVNEGIEQTLREEPGKFHYYNNGLTITTIEINDSNAKNYLITPVNIVNGCQTANSVFNIFKTNHDKEKDVKIPVRIIVAQDTENENITIRTNTQNGLDEKELKSITNMQRELEKEFEKMRFFNKSFLYKRQNSIEIASADVDYVIKIDDILRASFSTMLLIPNKVSGYFDKTTSKLLDIIFDDRYMKLYAILTVLFKIIENEIEENYCNFNRLKYHLCYLFYKFVNKNEDCNSIEAYFRNRKSATEELNEDELNNQNELITRIYSNIYGKLKNRDTFINIIKYIISKVTENYPDLLDLSTKERERILYKPVERLYRIRSQPVFGNFEEIFSESLETFMTENEETKTT
jgi:hypothetical protein